MKKQYMALIENPEAITAAQELTLTIRDLTEGRHKYEAYHVVATVYPTAVADADVLVVRHGNGRLWPSPWSIKITKEIDEFTPGRPYAGVVD